VALAGWIFVKLGTGDVLQKSVMKLQILLQLDKNIWHFVWKLKFFSYCWQQDSATMDRTYCCDSMAQLSIFITRLRIRI